MSFPNISFKHTGVEVNYQLQDLVKAKLSSLDRYIGGKDGNRCEVEFAKVAPHQHGDLYRVEVNIWSDGVLYRANEKSTNFESAIDKVRDVLDTEMKKSRTKKQSLFRRGARKMKQIMRWGR